jgi:ASC-1-like (ASCH) protein
MRTAKEGEMEHNFWVKSQEVLPLFERGKKLEVRVRNGYPERIKIGDILFINQKIRRRVVAIRTYRDFPAMLKIEKARDIHPDMDHDALLRFMRELCPPRLEKKGVLVFELRPI